MIASTLGSSGLGEGVMLLNEATLLATRTYEYDALGRRISEPGRELYWSADGNVIEDRASSSVVQYVWSGIGGNHLVLRDADSDANRSTTYDPRLPAGVDERIYAITDASGSVTAITDWAGNVLERYLYTPEGKLEIRTPDMSTVRTNSGYGWGYTYHSGRRDGQGLYYVGGQVYDYLTANPVQPDPASYWGILNEMQPPSLSWYDRTVLFAAPVAIGVVVGVATGGLGFLAAGALGGLTGGFAGGFTTAYGSGAGVGDSLKVGAIGGAIGGVAGGLGGALAGRIVGGASNAAIRGAGQSFGVQLGREALSGAVEGAAGGLVEGGYAGWQAGGLSGMVSGAATGALYGAGIGAGFAGGLINARAEGADWEGPLLQGSLEGGAGALLGGLSGGLGNQIIGGMDRGVMRSLGGRLMARGVEGFATGGVEGGIRGYMESGTLAGTFQGALAGGALGAAFGAGLYGGSLVAAAAMRSAGPAMRTLGRAIAAEWHMPPQGRNNPFLFGDLRNGVLTMGRRGPKNGGAGASRAPLYEVRLAKDLRTNPWHGVATDTVAEHAPQTKWARDLIPGHSEINDFGWEPAIRVTRAEADAITLAEILTQVPAGARDALAMKIRILRNLTDAPNRLEQL